MNKQLDFTKLKPDFVRRKAIDVSVEIDLKQLSRLYGVLADNEGTLLVKCDFTKDEYGIDLMRLNIDGDLKVSCQRCLEPFTYHWQSNTMLQLDHDESLNEDASDELYERITLANDKTLNLFDVVTDEIILGLPLYHPNNSTNTDLTY